MEKAERPKISVQSTRAALSALESPRARGIILKALARCRGRRMFRGSASATPTSSRQIPRRLSSGTSTPVAVASSSMPDRHVSVRQSEARARQKWQFASVYKAKNRDITGPRQFQRRLRGRPVLLQPPASPNRARVTHQTRSGHTHTHCSQRSDRLERSRARHSFGSRSTPARLQQEQTSATLDRTSLIQ